MKLEFKGERLTVDINETTRKPQDRESIQLAETTRSLEQKKMGKKLLAESPSEFNEYAGLERKATDWCAAAVTEGMDHPSVDKIILECCEPPQSAESGEAAPPMRVKGKINQNIPLRNVPKESPPLPKVPTPIEELVPAPALQATAKTLPTQARREPRRLNIQEQKNQLLGKTVLNQGITGKEVPEQMEIDLGPCLHSAKTKGTTPILNPQNRRREPKGEQREILSQHRLDLISRKRKSRLADSNTSMVIRPGESVERRKHDSDVPSFWVNGSKAEPYKDKTEAGIVGEIPLNSPKLSQ